MIALEGVARFKRDLSVFSSSRMSLEWAKYLGYFVGQSKLAEAVLEWREKQP